MLETLLAVVKYVVCWKVVWCLACPYYDAIQKRSYHRDASMTTTQSKQCSNRQEVEASEVKMRLDEALSVHRQAATRENEQEGYWQVLRY